MPAEAAARSKHRRPRIGLPQPRETDPKTEFIRGCLAVAGVLMLGFVLSISLFGHLRFTRDQQELYAKFRVELANQQGPVGPTATGDPVAIIEVPSLSWRYVVVEGTASHTLMSGPGHRRDTVLPGQAGTSVIYGRRAGFGAPFAILEQLRNGQTFTVTTGQGVSTYRVRALRREGDPLPAALASGAGRLTLLTAAGTAYLPSGVLRVDADLITPAFPNPSGPLPPRGPDESPLDSDSSGLPVIVLWFQALLVTACAIAWLQRRIGTRQAWLIGLPVMGFLGVMTADQLALLLPNLL